MNKEGIISFNYKYRMKRATLIYKRNYIRDCNNIKL